MLVGPVGSEKQGRRRWVARLPDSAWDRREIGGQAAIAIGGAEEAMGRPAKGLHHRRSMQRMDVPP